MALSEQTITTLSILLVAALVAVIGLFVIPSEPVEDGGEPEMVQPHENSSVIYPYTTRRPTFESRTIDINVIVYGQPDRFRTFLMEQADETWNETDEEFTDTDPQEPEADALNATETDWGEAAGATRYLYVNGSPHGMAGRWITESYQLHHGDYLGSRYHMRVYESPYEADNWIAVQAHTEHWDWFQLRHTVDSTSRAQLRIEDGFMGQWFVNDVWRAHLGNDDVADSDGWATLIDINEDPRAPIGLTILSPLGLLIGLGLLAGDVSRSLLPPRLQAWLWDRYDQLMGTIDPYPLLLFSSLIAVYLFVRLGAVGVERHLLQSSPKVVAGLFYPVLVLGLPLAAYAFAKRVELIPAFVAATLGITTAILVDYTYLGIAVLPIAAMVHRVGVVMAIGLIATGAARKPADLDFGFGYYRAGVVLWFVIIVQPFLRFLPVF